LDAADTADTTPPEPPVVTLTVNAIPAEMNGSVPFLDDADGELHDFRLRVNRGRFTLDALADRRAGPVDWDTAALTCLVGETAVTLPPAPTIALGGWTATWAVDVAAAIPDGAAVDCAIAVSGPGGATASAVAFDAATLPPELDPFAEEDVWLVVTSRDLFEVVSTARVDGTYDIRSTYVPGGNGLPDFDEPFYEMGLMSPDNPEANALVRAHLLRRIRERAYAIYGLDADGGPTADGVNMRLYFEGDPGAPDPADFDGGGFSMIALGGDGTNADQVGGIFGRALIDWNNQGHEDDTRYGLGVYPTALARVALGQPLGTLLLEDLLPATGVPIGADARDMAFVGKDELPAGVDPETSHRFDLYALAIDVGSLALSSILCHEIGHSLGLVPEGPPPVGLFAGIEGPAFLASFVPDAHIDTAGLNVMQTGGSVNWFEAYGSEPRFNALNWAYLTRRLVVGPPAAD
ncbi:MAG: hypothetical protein KC635_29505, partial [Myxococcales bacterium]|nr:hypothetical protein [Myxococcales bacterium]